MQTNLKTLAAAHSESACYFGDHPDWLIVFSMHRGSDLVEKTNFEAMQGALEELAEVKGWAGEWHPVTVERSSHWAVGWVDYLVVDPACTAAVEAAREMLRQLEDYPVLDEEALSEAEYEEFEESWNSWGRDDFMRALEKRFRDELEDCYFAPFSMTEAVEMLGDMDADSIDGWRETAERLTNWVYQADGSGVIINIMGLAEMVDIEEVAEAALAELWAKQRRADIVKLGKWAGACPAEIQQALSIGIDRLTGFQQLMQGGI